MEYRLGRFYIIIRNNHNRRIIVKRAGIYKILNIENNKVYIGSSARLRKRKYEHFKFLETGKHCNSHLQNSYNKHGKNSFKWEVLENINDIDDLVELKKVLLEREQYYLDLYESYNPKKGYNFCPLAGSRLGSKGVPLSEEIKRKLRVFNKGLIPYNKGKQLSQEHRDKIKKALKGKPKSEEHATKAREAGLNRKRRR